MGWEVCEERTPPILQALIDRTIEAKHYFTDAFKVYEGLIYWGTHQVAPGKSQTYSVEAVNADLRHYLARLMRRSRCFSRCLKALRRAVDLFVHFYNQHRLRRVAHPEYPTHWLAQLSHPI